MRTKMITYLSLIFIILVGLYFIIESIPILPQPENETGLSAGFFPFWLSIILIFLCFLSIVQTMLKKENKEFKIPRAGYLIVTVILTALYFFSWNYFGYFYFQTGLYLLILISVYKFSSGLTMKNVGVNVCVSLGFTISIYILFDVVMGVKF